MPIDINCLRAYRGGDPESVKETQRKRFKPVELVDDIMALDEQWRNVQTEVALLGKQKRDLSKAVALKRKAGGDASAEMEESKMVSERLEAANAESDRLKTEVEAKLAEVGNFVDPTVPVSNDETHNAIVSSWGERPDLPAPEHHHDLLHMIGGYEPERGVRVAGHRAYFLRGPGVLLNQALINYGIAFLSKRAYVPMQPPFFMNKDVMAGVAQLSDFDESLYHVTGASGEEKYLIATSEQPICAMHKGEWLEESELPLRYAGYSTCFRKESGKTGQDTWGIFRVHQFEKVEQFCITTPEKSAEMHEEMIRTAEEFYQSLGLPYRVVNIVSGELNNAAAKKYDLEGWFPGYGAFRELVSCSNCTDYQSRAMEIRCGAKKMGDREKRYVHMLNATLCATTRTVCCILENYQTPEGIRVPEVLVPFLGGVTFLPFINPKKENLNKAKMERAEAKKKGAAQPAQAAAPREHGEVSDAAALASI